MRGTHHHTPTCTRAHQAAALLLVAATFLLTRLLSTSPSLPYSTTITPLPEPRDYGADLRIYVYSEDEIDGLRSLLHGHHNTVHTATCLKGQWGTQARQLDP